MTDVKAWNRKHGAMWIGYGVIIIVSWMSAVFIKNEIASVVITFTILIGGLSGMFVGHHKFVKMYLRKNDMKK